MDQEHKQILNGLKSVLTQLHKTQATLEKRLEKIDGEFLRIAEWKIYHEVISKDLNNLGSKIRKVESLIADLQKENQKQNLEHNTLATKFGTILGILGGLSGVGALIAYLIRQIGG